MTKTAQLHEKLLAMNEELVLGSLRQHELTEAADSLNTQLQEEIAERKQVEAALRESEERYRNLFNSIDEGFCVIEKIEGGVGEAPDFLYLEANPAFAAQSGMSGMVGKTIRQMLPDEPEGWCSIYDTVLRTGEPIRFERGLVSHGRVLELYAFRVEEETHRRVAVIFKDITGRKQAELALRESEERFRALFELGPVAVYSCDSSGVIQNFNRRAAELWGREPAVGDTDERFCGSFKLFRPDGGFMPHEQCPMAEVLSGKISEARDAEVLIERPDGSRVTVIVNIRPLKNPRGEVTGAINCFYDITERKQAEEALRKWEYIFNHAGWAVVAADPETNHIIMANPAFAQMHGYTVEEMVGKPLADSFAVESRAELPEHVDGTNKQGDYIYESMHLRKDGTVFPTLTHVSALKDAKGQLLYRAATVRDITERKEAERRQTLLTNELAHRGKNLLAIILSIASSSLSGTRPLAEARDVFIQRLHALSRSQSLLMTEGFEGAPLAEIVRQEFESFSDRVKAVGPHVMLNPRVAQTFAFVVHELATNASKYGALSRPDGRIAIHWSIEGAGADERFKFHWKEVDGPPVVPPTREGFGRVLLEKAVAQEFGAPPKVRFAPEGLSYEIDAPLSVVAAPNPRGRGFFELSPS